MSRSGYNDDYDSDQWSMICWRGAVASAIKGKRGQAFLSEMLSALEALPERKLIARELEKDGAVCAIGSVGKIRGIDTAKIDPEDYDAVARLFGISSAMAREIAWMNDEFIYGRETPEERFVRMKRWVESQIRSGSPGNSGNAPGHNK